MVIAALLGGSQAHFRGVRFVHDAPPHHLLAMQSVVNRQHSRQAARQTIKQQIRDDDEALDDFEGYGSISEMAKHKDDMVDKQLHDPKFIAQINAQEEAKKKKKEEKVRIEKVKKEAIANAKKQKEIKIMKDRLKQNLNKKLVAAHANVQKQNDTKPAAPAPKKEEPAKPVEAVKQELVQEKPNSAYQNAINSVLNKKKHQPTVSQA